MAADEFGAVEALPRHAGEVRLRVFPHRLRRGPAEPVLRQVSFAVVGTGLCPFSAAHVQRPFRRPRAPGDLVFGRVRRSRVLSADGWRLAEVPPDPDAAGWKVDLVDGGAARRRGAC
ncbi:hypothetical protein CCR87_15845 [Rhodobaculum claviforme]|uniref:Uncharacterized protein n=1 Tax=Rhodobaculum claviforme TaxID=1549854 RepID=A0A934TPG8_9RHOB|nr:hypothetical protein [Rhodobaculum claviforme]